MNLIKYSKQPFPKVENKWKIIIFISLFVALFLIIFQPFRINLFNGSNKLFILSGYGLVTFSTLIVNLIIIENIFNKFFDERRWKVWKEFVWLAWIIFSIGLGNAFYTSIIFAPYFNSNLSFYINFQLITLVVGMIPITVLIISKQKYLTQKYTHSANLLNKNIEHKTETSENSVIRFYADNEKDFIEFNVHDFYFIESSGNYVNIYYNENSEIIRKTLRNTIKNSLSFFKNINEVMQCHRAFIVNTSKIINAKGNSQGLRLDLENCDMEVPVSRGYVEKIKQKLG